MARIKSDIIKIEQIIIYLDTTIPSAPRGGADPEPTKTAAEPEKKMIKLESKLLYNPKLTEKTGLSDLPYITYFMKYPVWYLRGILQDDTDPTRFDYNKVVRFFFNREFFKKQMNLFSNDVAIRQKLLHNQEKNAVSVEAKTALLEKANKEKNEILNFNIKYMMQMLFPTKFPTSNNFSFSFDEYIEQTSVPSTYIVPIDYSYLNINDKKYTVIKVTVLNDVVNDPLYREIIEIYNDYVVKNEQVSKLNEEEIRTLKTLIIERMYKLNQNDTEYYNLRKTFYSFTINNKLLQEFVELSTGKIENPKEKRTHIESNSDTYTQYKIKDIQDKISDLEKKQEKQIIGQQYNSSQDPNYMLLLVYNNYKIINENIDEIYSIMDKSDSSKDSEYLKTTISNEMQIIVERLESIRKSIDIISKDQRITNEAALKRVTEKLLEQFKQLNELININNKFNGDNPRINLDRESANTKDIIVKKNPIFAKFVEKVKDVIFNHRTSNEKLYKIFRNFYNSKTAGDITIFNEMYTSIVNELLNNETKDYFEKKQNRDKILTGIHFINMKDDSKPQYEIYVAMDLFEGEVNDSNVKTCNYRAYYLGQELENMIDRFDYKYDINAHRLFIPFVDDAMIPKIPDKMQIPDKKKGGKHKYTLKKGRNMIKKSRKRMRCSLFNKMCRYH